jgi:benzylsuccinate CoA-transferase BbsF subunit
MAGPLSGVRVLDLSWIIAGPYTGRLLADFGAQVIKVESRNRMDIGRANRTPLYGELPGDANSNPDTGGYFQDVNAGKLSCTLNLATDSGRELLRQLVAVSDVTICNLGGDQYERWGIGYEVARELNPGVIMLNLPSMESSGERTGWRGFGDMFVGIAGLKSVSGHEGEPPLLWGHNYADFSSNPFHAAVAIMAALLQRDRTGEGQFIEVSQYESTMALIGPALLQHSLTGEAPQPAGNRDALASPHNFYRCSGEDSWCAIAVETDEQWQSLVELSGLAHLDRAAFASVEGRRAAEVVIDEEIEGWTRGWKRQELADELQARGVPAGPFQKIDEIVHQDPTLSEQHFERLPHPVGRDFLVHRNPIRTRRQPPETRLGPLIGEHTFEVLSEVLGLSADEIANYAAQDALE